MNDNLEEDRPPDVEPDITVETAFVPEVTQKESGVAELVDWLKTVKVAERQAPERKMYDCARLTEPLRRSTS